MQERLRRRARRHQQEGVLFLAQDDDAEMFHHGAGHATGCENLGGQVERANPFQRCARERTRQPQHGPIVRLIGVVARLTQGTGYRADGIVSLEVEKREKLIGLRAQETNRAILRHGGFSTGRQRGAVGFGNRFLQSGLALKRHRDRNQCPVRNFCQRNFGILFVESVKRRACRQRLFRHGDVPLPDRRNGVKRSRLRYAARVSGRRR